MANRIKLLGSFVVESGIMDIHTTKSNFIPIGWNKIIPGVYCTPGIWRVSRIANTYSPILLTHDTVDLFDVSHFQNMNMYLTEQFISNRKLCFSDANKLNYSKYIKVYPGLWNLYTKSFPKNWTNINKGNMPKLFVMVKSESEDEFSALLPFIPH